MKKIFGGIIMGAAIIFVVLNWKSFLISLSMAMLIGLIITLPVYLIVFCCQLIRTWSLYQAHRNSWEMSVKFFEEVTSQIVIKND